MHYPQLARAAQFMNTTTPVTTPTPTPTPGPGGDGLPATIGDFALYGCVQSNDNFPSFTLIGSTEDMSLDFCAASCPSRFFGVFSTDCYCGDELDTATSKRVNNDLCDTVCPGNDEEFCGGLVVGGRRRQAVPSSVLLTVYIRISGDDDNGDGDNTGAPTTITNTITSTTTGTVTTCPPEVTDCPLTTGVTTITTTFCPEQTPGWGHKKIVCYGDYCAPEEPCQECERHRVVCDDEWCRPEVCDNDQWNQLVVCKGDNCHFNKCEGDACNTEKVVCWDGKCAKEKCYGDECKKNLVCEGDECKHEACTGDSCYQKQVCTGNDCTVSPPCSGPSCPTPAPPAPVPNPHPVVPTPGPSNVIPPVTPPVSPTGPVVGGSDKMLPAVGFTLGAIAAFAMLL